MFYHFVCLRPVSCAPNVARVSGMFILDWPFIRSIYLSVDTIFQGMWFLSWFPWQRIATNKNGNGIRSLRNRKTWLTITEYLCHKSPRIYIYIYIYSVCRNHNQGLSSFMTYHWICNESNTTSVISAAGTAYISLSVSSGVRVARSLFFCVVFSRSLFHFFILPIVYSVLLRAMASD